MSNYNIKVKIEPDDTIIQPQMLGQETEPDETITQLQMLGQKTEPDDTITKPQMSGQETERDDTITQPQISNMENVSVKMEEVDYPLYDIKTDLDAPCNICVSCGHFFADACSLTTHIITQHAPQCPNICLLCGQGFDNFQDMAAHRDAHSQQECVKMSDESTNDEPDSNDTIANQEHVTMSDESTVDEPYMTDKIETQGRFKMSDESTNDKSDMTDKISSSEIPILDVKHDLYHLKQCVDGDETVCKPQSGEGSWPDNEMMKNSDFPSQSMEYAPCSPPLYSQMYEYNLSENVMKLDNHSNEHKTSIMTADSTKTPEGTLPLDGAVNTPDGTVLPDGIFYHPQAPPEKTEHINQKICPICSKGFRSVSKLARHMRTHTGEKPFKCDVCEKSFSDSSALTLHHKKSGGKCVGYECQGCNQSFNQKELLLKHIAEHIQENEVKNSVNKKKLFTCEFCGKIFKKLSHYMRHVRTHTGEKPYKCDVCEESFVEAHLLAKHLVKHTGEERFKCPECEDRFSMSKQVTNHRIIVHGLMVSDKRIRDKNKLCTICGEWFSTQNFKSHQRRHNGDTKYKCDVCGMECSSLVTHMRTHTGEKPYQCNECNKSFSLRGSLTSHKRIHSGVKPYKCSYCEKGFCWKNNLTKHERTHTGDRPYTCDKCEAKFAYSFQFREHLKIHT